MAESKVDKFLDRTNVGTAVVLALMSGVGYVLHLEIQNEHLSTVAEVRSLIASDYPSKEYLSGQIDLLKLRIDALEKSKP
jgi:hypothetical protein